MSRNANAPNPLCRAVDRMAQVPLLRVFVEAFQGKSRASDAMLLLLSFSCVAVAIFAIRKVGAYDTDGWWILATGREILENGIPHVCTWAVEGMYPVVIQQWLHDVIAYSMYVHWGYAGVDLYAMALAGVAAVAVYASVRFLSNGKAAVASCVATACLGISGIGIYMSIRPTMFSVMAFLAVICICVGARRSGKPSLCLLLPVVVCIHMQFQMSIVALDVMTAAAFLLPWSKTELADGMGRYAKSRLPLLGCILLMLAASLVNPYGIDGALYLLRGYSEAAYSGAISEMQPVWKANPFIAFVWLTVVLVPLLVMAKQGKLPPIPVLVLLLGGLAASALHIRNIWMLTAASMVLVSFMLRPCSEGRLQLRHPLAGGMALALLCTACMAIAFPLNRQVMPVPDDEEAVISSWEEGEAVRPLAERIQADYGEDAKVYVNWELLNAILEWDGLKVAFDIRPELWIGTDNAGNAITPYRDFIDSKNDDESLSRYVLSGGWDCYLVPTSNSGAYAEQFALKEVTTSGQFSLMEPTEITEMYERMLKNGTEGE